MWPFKKKVVVKPVVIPWVKAPDPKPLQFYLYTCYADHPFLEIDSNGVVQVLDVKDGYVKFAKFGNKDSVVTVSYFNDYFKYSKYLNQ